MDPEKRVKEKGIHLWPKDIKIMWMGVYLGLLIGILGGFLVSSTLGLAYLLIKNKTVLILLYIIVLISTLFFIIYFSRKIKQMTVSDEENKKKEPDDEQSEIGRKKKITKGNIIGVIILFVFFFGMIGIIGFVTGTTLSVERGSSSDFIAFEDFDLYDGDKVEIRFFGKDIQEMEVYFVPYDVYQQYQNYSTGPVEEYKHISIENERKTETFVVPYDNEKWGLYAFNFDNKDEELRFQIREPSVKIFESRLLINMSMFLFILFFLIIIIAWEYELGYFHFIIIPLFFVVPNSIIITIFFLKKATLFDFIAIFGILFTFCLLTYREYHEVQKYFKYKQQD